MRIGLVGVSTPTVLRLQWTAACDQTPNPILDSPFGLMLLYDELTRAPTWPRLRRATFAALILGTRRARTSPGRISPTRCERGSSPRADGYNPRLRRLSGNGTLLLYRIACLSKRCTLGCQNGAALFEDRAQ